MVQLINYMVKTYFTFILRHFYQFSYVIKYLFCFLGEWCNLLKENEKFFNDLSNKRSNESLRVGPIKANELFGTDGSFKKLNLD